MVMLAPFISVLALLAAQPVAVAAPPTGAQPARAVILACNLPTRSVAGAPATGSGERIFRIAPGSFQEWNSTRREFGGNLCGAYTCVRTANKTEGTLSSASVIYTVGITGNRGYWSVVGASGGGPRTGACRILAVPRPA